MDSDDQFVADNINGGIRTIGETVRIFYAIKLSLLSIRKKIFGRQLERIVFSQQILVPLLGPGLVRPCHVYHIDLEEIEEIGRALDNLRPGRVNRYAGFHPTRESKTSAFSMHSTSEAQATGARVPCDRLP